MTQPFFRVLQAIVRWLLAVCWTCTTLLATAVLFFGNFVVAWQAFVLLGFEPEPLLNVPLIGPLATAAGVGDAPLASLYAAVLTAAMAGIVIGTVKLATESLTLALDLRQAKLTRQADTTAVTLKLIEALIWLVILAVPTVLVAQYDVSLFNVRLQSLLTGQEIEDALKWTSEEVGRLGGFLADFAVHARWGYLAIIAGVAFVSEKAFQRASERWLVLGQTIDTAIGGAPLNEAVNAAPQAPAATAGPEAPRAPETEPQTQSAPDTSMPHVEQGAQTPTADTGQRTRTGAATHRPVPPPPQAADPVSAPPPPPGPTVPVVWGPGEGRQMPLAEVERNLEEYVRDGSGRAWFRRSYYEQVRAAESHAHPQNEPQPTNEEEPSHV